mmetsp:Transcript_4800/g.16922  ORF Transcript_4800/g.16922 Transcript_4800/m.16922 type:complete len:254 (+) Transcript_4800:443-1204(+)
MHQEADLVRKRDGGEELAAVFAGACEARRDFLLWLDAVLAALSLQRLPDNARELTDIATGTAPDLELLCVLESLAVGHLRHGAEETVVEVAAGGARRDLELAAVQAEALGNPLRVRALDGVAETHDGRVHLHLEVPVVVERHGAVRLGHCLGMSRAKGIGAAGRLLVTLLRLDNDVGNVVAHADALAVLDHLEGDDDVRQRSVLRILLGRAGEGLGDHELVQLHLANVFPLQPKVLVDLRHHVVEAVAREDEV